MNEVLTAIWTFASTPMNIGSLQLPFSLVDLALQFVIPFLVGVVLLRLIRKSLIRLLYRSSMRDENKETVVRWIKIIFRILGLALMVILSTFLLGAEFFTVLKSIGSILNEPFFKTGDLSISVLTIITAIPVFYIASWAGKASRRIIEKEVLRRIPVDESRRFSIANISRYAVMMLVVIMGLSLIGINLSSLLVIFSVLGIGIGFGLQGLVANFFAGLIIIITRPIKEGDFIVTASTAQPVEGHVVKITLLHSVINTLLNESVIVPNTHIIQSPVHNYSYDDPQISVPMLVGVHYDSDLDQVEEVLMGVGHDCPYWNKKLPPRVTVLEFADSGINMGLYVRITKGSDRFMAMGWLRKETWRRFKSEGIVIPYPQMDLYIKEGLPGTGAFRAGIGPAGSGRSGLQEAGEDE